MSTDLDHSSSSFSSSSSSSSSCYHVDDDYIDMEMSSSSNNLFCYSPQNREFEFQMSSICKDKDAATFPADELFYKGKLLPLHLPPRLQMVQKLLQNPSATTATTTTNTFYSKNETFQDSIPFISFPTTTTTPLESCNITPSECCTVSCELNPDDYFFELSTEINSFIVHQTPKKKSWTKKLKQSLLLGKNLKASSAYLKYLSFFNKSGYGNESCAKAEPEVISKDNNNNNNYMKVAKKNSSFANTLMKSIEKEMGSSEIFHSQRRSFSGAIQRHSTTNYKSLSSSSGSSSSSSSFSFSSSSNGFCDLQLLKRSNSVNSDIESSIEGAIAYCKKSHQQLFCSAKVTATEVL